MTWLIAKQINLYRENILKEALCSENFELDVACNMLHTSCRDPCNFVAKKVAPCIPSLRCEKCCQEEIVAVHGSRFFILLTIVR